MIKKFGINYGKNFMINMLLKKNIKQLVNAFLFALLTSQMIVYVYVVYYYEAQLCTYNGYWIILACLQFVASVFCTIPWDYLLSLLKRGNKDKTRQWDNDVRIRIKLVVVGDGEIGKTQLLVRYETGPGFCEFPAFFHNVTLEQEIMIDEENVPISLELFDTTGQEEYQNSLHLTYGHMDIFLVCFSVVEKSSFLSLETKWLPGIEDHSSDAVIVLVGTQCHLKDAPDKQSISAAVIEEYRKKIGAAAYIETSAVKNINVEQAFEVGIIAFLNQSQL
eukprot:58738_1